ncbi:MAG: hypothetical protein GF416_08235 [Candidatus Altiarchaeales archaeon]|nr:hypothetical protein [Candidatus Altiarchaeales archaeon]MBD3417103.1 hypothetical protein [Candidatus Altiarchaeales archaeon]
MVSTACAQARFDSVSIEPPYIEPGNDVNVYVKFHEGLNKRDILVTPTKDDERLPVGDDTAVYYLAVLTPKDDATSDYILVKDQRKSIGHMYPGETWTAPFEIHVSDSAPPTTYTLSFEVLKTDIQGTEEGEVILSREIGLDVKGVPSFTLASDSQLRSGETKDFHVTVSNVGGGTARHVLVSLNATSPLTVLKSSTLYAGDMSGVAAKNLVYELHVDSSAEPRAYSIPVEITYTDRNGSAHMVTKSIGVKVQGMPVVTANLDSQDDVMEAMSGSITLSVVNKGFIDAKFLSLELEDSDQYTVTSNHEVYIGNLASDDFETEDFTVKVAEGVTGKVPLKVKVSYTEENNNEMHLVQPELYLNVLPSDEYYALHPKTNGSQQIMGVVFAVPALIVGYIVLWLLFKIVNAITGFIDRKVFRKT